MSAEDTSEQAEPATAPWKRWLQLAVAVAITATFVWLASRYLMAQGDVWSHLKLRDPTTLGAIVASTVALFLVMAANGVIMRDLVAQTGVRLGIKDWLGITLVSSMLNLVSPIKGGAAVRALYLKRAHGVSLTAYATVIAGSLAFSLAVSGLLAAAALLALGVPGGAYGWLALATSVALVIGLALALWLAPTLADPAAVTSTKTRLLARLTRLAQGWRAISRDRALLAKLSLWNLVAALLHGVAFFFAFRIAGFSGSWLVPVTSSAFARIGALVAITPAGLGIMEAFGAVSAQIAGADPGPALLGVLIVRVLGAAVTVIGGAAFSPLLVRGAARGRA